MKKLTNENFAEFELLNPCHINGGDGSTSYSTDRGRSGSDCYSDDDGDGRLSRGDGVLLDTGEWINKQ